VRIGKFEILIAWDNYFKLDGGAMFGIVPKLLWNKTNPADERNRILLSLNPMVIRFDKEIFIVDTGIGDKWDKKNKDILALVQTSNMTKSLSEMGINKEDITGVILTHLHFDHTGGSVEKDTNGSLMPAFPNAQYYIQQGEWDFAVNPNERTKASYLPDNFLPLHEHRRVRFLKGDEEIVGGIRVEVTGGHTPHHQIVLIESGGKKACYLGDIIPTNCHIKIPYIMGYDTNPLDTLEAKKRLLRRAIEENWLIVFPHAPRIRAGYLKQTENGIILTPADLNED